MKGVDDLDFFIGDEAIDKPTYATKVRKSLFFFFKASQICTLLLCIVLDLLDSYLKKHIGFLVKYFVAF